MGKKIHTIDGLHEIAKQFRTRTALKHGHYGAYSTMLKWGILDSCCAHMEKDKPGYDPVIPDEEIAAAFKRHTTLGAVKRGPDSRFYRVALYRYHHGSDKWKEITAHMGPPKGFGGSNHMIYALEFSDNHAYVGQTLNMKRRLEVHQSMGPVHAHILANPSATYEIKILETGLRAKQVKEREGFWQSEQKLDGWIPLWSSGPGGLGFFSPATKDDVMKAAQSCQTRNEFRTKFQRMAVLAKKRGWFEEAVAHMPKMAPVSAETKARQSLAATLRVRSPEEEAKRKLAVAASGAVRGALPVLPYKNAEDNVARYLRKKGYRRPHLRFVVEQIETADLMKVVVGGRVRFSQELYPSGTFLSREYADPTWLDVAEAAEMALRFTGDCHHVFLEFITLPQMGADWVQTVSMSFGS